MWQKFGSNNECLHMYAHVTFTSTQWIDNYDRVSKTLLYGLIPPFFFTSERDILMHIYKLYMSKFAVFCWDPPITKFCWYSWYRYGKMCIRPIPIPIPCAPCDRHRTIIERTELESYSSLIQKLRLFQFFRRETVLCFCRDVTSCTKQSFWSHTRRWSRKVLGSQWN